jgi:hypothetical protein
VCILVSLCCEEEKDDSKTRHAKKKRKKKNREHVPSLRAILAKKVTNDELLYEIQKQKHAEEMELKKKSQDQKFAMQKLQIESQERIAMANLNAQHHMIEKLFSELPNRFSNANVPRP